jgi:hypothetical protein
MVNLNDFSRVNLNERLLNAASERDQIAIMTDFFVEEGRRVSTGRFIGCGELALDTSNPRVDTRARLTQTLTDLGATI